MRSLIGVDRGGGATECEGLPCGCGVARGCAMPSGGCVWDCVALRAPCGGLGLRRIGVECSAVAVQALACGCIGWLWSAQPGQGVGSRCYAMRLLCVGLRRLALACRSSAWVSIAVAWRWGAWGRVAMRGLCFGGMGYTMLYAAAPYSASAMQNRDRLRQCLTKLGTDQQRHSSALPSCC